MGRREHGEIHLISENTEVTTVNNLAARSVFFVKDTERSLSFYTEPLGFSLDWNHQEQGRAFVFQASLLGFQLILNQTETWTQGRAGRGRVFIGLDSEQAGKFLRHVEDYGIKTSVFTWGAPTLVIRDLDENEFFIWLPENERASLETRLGAGN